MKLADDFEISYRNRVRDSSKSGKKSPVKEKGKAPKTPEKEWDEHFAAALKELSIVEYYLDILLFGNEEDKKILVKEKGKEAERKRGYF